VKPAITERKLIANCCIRQKVHRTAAFSGNRTRTRPREPRPRNRTNRVFSAQFPNGDRLKSNSVSESWPNPSFPSRLFPAVGAPRVREIGQQPDAIREFGLQFGFWRSRRRPFDHAVFRGPRRSTPAAHRRPWPRRSRLLVSFAGLLEFLRFSECLQTLGSRSQNRLDVDSDAPTGRVSATISGFFQE